jgi:undecaprenyl diphosphate synthase
MDGNGRWAKARGLPRTAGHVRGVVTVRNMVQACGERGIEFLTLFAFSSENWRRPADEVSTLMRQFMLALQRETRKLIEHGVRLRVVGDLLAFDGELRRQIAEAERITHHNQGLQLTVCANYGGRWDIAQAASRAAHARSSSNPFLRFEETDLTPHFALAFAPDPDLLIRTGGERRLSNFLLWQMAYTELWFSEVLWPDFGAGELDAALAWFAGRQRRFGMTDEQLATADVPDAA